MSEVTAATVAGERVARSGSSPTWATSRPLPRRWASSAAQASAASAPSDPSTPTTIPRWAFMATGSVDPDPRRLGVACLRQANRQDAVGERRGDALLGDRRRQPNLVGERAGDPRRVPQHALALLLRALATHGQPAGGHVDRHVVPGDAGQVQFQDECILGLLELAAGGEAL